MTESLLLQSKENGIDQQNPKEQQLFPQDTFLKLIFVDCSQTQWQKQPTLFRVWVSILMRFKRSIMCISTFMIWQIDRQTGQVEVVLNERDLDKVAIAVAELDFDILILFVIGFVQAQLKLELIMRL